MERAKSKSKSFLTPIDAALNHWNFSFKDDVDAADRPTDRTDPEISMDRRRLFGVWYFFSIHSRLIDWYIDRSLRRQRKKWQHTVQFFFFYHCLLHAHKDFAKAPLKTHRPDIRHINSMYVYLTNIRTQAQNLCPRHACALSFLANDFFFSSSNILVLIPCIATYGIKLLHESKVKDFPCATNTRRANHIFKQAQDEIK